MIRSIFFLTVLALLSPAILLTPVSDGEETDQEVSQEVKELQNLRNEYAEPPNSTHDPEEPLPTPLPSHEEPEANSRSAIFRHRGITQAKKDKYWNENGGYAKYAGIQYSPQDLAAYVFNTGDEEGVAVAVEELVREGLMGRTDAINYLQDVKQILMYLRDQYEKQKEEMKSRTSPELQMTQRFPVKKAKHSLSEDNEKTESKDSEESSSEPTIDRRPVRIVLPPLAHPNCHLTQLSDQESFLKKKTVRRLSLLSL
ncbi:uncharacterized protein CEXT_295781 [Caerostris extrusa]|uniref:Uncharacterized protein n=1 Tax=Caerostris extrusa TaxID=172846 RepID=A0AAV4RUM6_CAEEX|nr:uncharacterized protein CEXT_295781 [Caerostris extrusa]